MSVLVMRSVRGNRRYSLYFAFLFTTKMQGSVFASSALALNPYGSMVSFIITISRG
jgi:hypothetical protein